MAYDLVLKGARVIETASGIDRLADVAFDGDRFAAIGDDLTGAQERDVTGCIVTPGLIDLHTHVYWGGTSLSVEADSYARRCAATTLVDTGSAGAGNFAGFRSHVIERADVRILAYIHISFAGIFAFSPTVMVGESQDMRLMAGKEAAAVAADNADHIVGIKVRVGRHTSGRNGIEPLRLAREVADASGLPIMAHIDEPDPDYEDVVRMLRPGDVLTHCFRPAPNAPIDAAGRIRDALVEARARGVLFDIGHGMGAFSWTSARGAMAAGFPPDTISSDVHVLCVDGPAWDLLRTMNKLLALGMSLTEVIRAATETPAKALRREQLGRLVPNGPGDASVIRLVDDPIALEDVTGEWLTWDRRLVPAARVLRGKYETIA